MRHILHKGRLLLFGLHDQLGSLFQFLVKAMGFIAGRTNTIHVLSERLQHRDVTILQASHLIDAGDTIYLYFQITLSYFLRLTEQLTQRT